MRTIPPNGGEILALLKEPRRDSVTVVGHIVNSNPKIADGKEQFATWLWKTFPWAAPPARQRDGATICSIFPGECSLIPEPDTTDRQDRIFVANLCCMTKEGKPTGRGADSRKKRLEHFATSLDSFLSKINNVDVDLSCSCWVLSAPRDIGYGSPCSATDWEPYEALLREFLLRECANWLVSSF